MNAIKGSQRFRKAARTLGVLALIGLSFTGICFAETLVQNPQESRFQFVLNPGSKLWLEGNSTLHAYASTATKMELSSEMVASQEPRVVGDMTEMVKKGGMKKLELSIPVKSLKSGKKGLDKNMHESLKADSYPAIVFRLTQYEIAQSTVNQSPILIKAKGRLSLAGKEKEIDLSIKALLAVSGIQASGTKELLMTDFGIKPPAMMLGVLKTDNKVVIRFDLLLGLESLLKQNAEKLKEVRQP